MGVHAMKQGGVGWGGVGLGAERVAWVGIGCGQEGCGRGSCGLPPRTGPSPPLRVCVLRVVVFVPRGGSFERALPTLLRTQYNS